MARRSTEWKTPRHSPLPSPELFGSSNRYRHRTPRRPRTALDQFAEYDEATRSYIDRASHLIDAAAATEVWEQALAAPPHQGRPLWVQGDLEGNCLVRDGRLCGIVDWGSACAGDPSVDIQVVWSPLFTEDSRRAFLEVLQVDDACIARSRGAAIHQACGALPYYLHTYPTIVERSWRKLETLGVSNQSRLVVNRLFP